MIFHSSAVSGPGLSRMESGTPILPMSCSSAAVSRTYRSWADMVSGARATHKSATRRACSAVYTSRKLRAEIRAETAW